jgi:hypothetical protein
MIQASVPMNDTSINYIWTNMQDSVISDSALATQLTAGIYTLTISDSTGCFNTEHFALSDSGSMNIVFNNNSILSLPCHDECSGIIELNLANNASLSQINWSNPGWSGPTINNVCAGNYSVIVTDTFGCSASELITVTQPSTQLNGNLLSPSQNSAEVIAEGGTPPYTYNWSNSLGDTATGAELTNITGGLEWTVTVTDNNGCSFESSIDVISSVKTLYHANRSVKVFPNPATDLVHITWSHQDAAPNSISIFNLAGQLIQQSFLPNLEGTRAHSINIDSLKPGIYFLSVSFGKTSQSAFKLIVY